MCRMRVGRGERGGGRGMGNDGRVGGGVVLVDVYC